MGEIRTEGYQSLRDFIITEWDYIELYDGNQNAVTRVSVSGDSRFAWQDIDGDSILQVYGEVSGTDSDIPLDTDLTYAALWDAASGGKQITPLEQYATQVINQEGDGMKLTHNVAVPL